MDYRCFLGERHNHSLEAAKFQGLRESRWFTEDKAEIPSEVLTLLDRATRHLEADEIYVEMGRAIGVTTIAALAHNPDVMAYVVDDPRAQWGARVNSSLISAQRLDILNQAFEAWEIADRVWLLPSSIEEFFVELRHTGSTDQIGLFFYNGSCDYRSLLVSLLMVEPYLSDRAAIVILGREQAGVEQAIADFLTVRVAGCKVDLATLDYDLPASLHLLIWDRQTGQSPWPAGLPIYPIGQIVTDPTTGDRLAQVDLVRPERLLSVVYDEARAYHTEQHLDRAELAYQSVLRRNPQHVGAQLHLGLLYYEQGKCHQALEALWQTLTLDPDHADAYYGLGLTYVTLGEPTHAIAAYHQALERNPQHFEALNNLGNLYYDFDRLERAADLFEQAIEAHPQRAGGYLNRARIELEHHNLTGAIHWYKRGLKHGSPHSGSSNSGVSNSGVSDSPGENGWGDLLHNIDLVQNYQLEPSPLYRQLATHATQQVQPHRALRHYYSLYHHLPTLTYARSLVNCYRALNQYDEAHNILGQALNRAAHSRGQQGEPPAAQEVAQEVALHQLMIQTELDRGHFEQAHAHSKRAIATHPSSAKLQLQHALLTPILYDTPAQIEQCRAAVFTGLAQLETAIEQSLHSDGWDGLEGKQVESVPSTDLTNTTAFANSTTLANSTTSVTLTDTTNSNHRPDDHPRIGLIPPADWLEAISQQTNFSLSYQGYDDRPFQERYGRLIRRLVCAVYPQLAGVGVSPQPSPQPSPQIQVTSHAQASRTPEPYLQHTKIGYVSSSMGPSRLGELTIGWIEHHDRQQFEIFGYYTQSACDGLTTRFRDACDRFHHHPDRDLETIAQTILADQLDVLIFTDLGIDPLLGVLAAMRLAPIQCTSWSHPITTGLETIDYFLSSAAMETETSDQHYSETLVRLADIGINFPRVALPETVTDRSALRQTLGLAIDKTLFLCCQSLFKYLPQDDPIWAAIAAGVPDAQLVFISHPSPHITQQFCQRLQRVFTEQGLEFSERVVMLPRLSEVDYLRVNQCCDVFLDSFHWSGGVTTLKAIACGLPIVTCPEALMRSRHSFGILRTLGITETIAATSGEYVTIAIRLAQDSRWREDLRQRTIAQHDQLFNNTACLRDLETFVCDRTSRPTSIFAKGD